MNGNKPKAIRIGIVDDHNLVRPSFARIIEEQIPGASVTLQAANGKDMVVHLMQLPEWLRPDLILLDVNMPVMDGFQSVRWLNKHMPAVKVIVLTMNTYELTIIRMLNEGVRGYLPKSCDMDELALAIRLVSNGEVFFKVPMEGSETLSGGNDLILERWLSLGPKEKEFVRLCCEDITDREIEGKIGLKPMMVDGIRKTVFDRFHVANRVSLVILAFKSRLFDV